MARKKAEKDEKKARKGERSGFMDKLSLIVTLLVVSVFAVFTGYLVGQYAIYWVASPIVGEARQEPSGTQAVETSTPSTQTTARPAPAESNPPQTAQTVTPQTPATSTAPTTPATQSSPSPSPQPSVYRVQVGRFSTQSAASAKLQALKASVPDAWVVRDAQSGEYRVQAGAFSSQARAEEFAGELAALGHDAFVVR